MKKRTRVFDYFGILEFDRFEKLRGTFIMPDDIKIRPRY